MIVMKRNAAAPCASALSLKKHKASVLHEVVKLLDKVSELELMQLQALISAKMPTLQTRKSHAHTVPIKIEKEGYDNQIMPPLIKLEKKYEYASGSIQFGQALARNINELQYSTFSLPDTKQESAVVNTKKSRRAHPDYIALRATVDELHTAKKRENVNSVWQLQDTSFIARFLLTQMKWRMERVANRIGTTWCPQNDSIVCAVVKAEPELFETHRQQAVTECKKLARRCGGLEALEHRFDHCSEYFKFCSLSFKFTKGERDGMKQRRWFEVFSSMQMGFVSI